MRISHPAESWQGRDPEDIFIATNDRGQILGSGYVEAQWLSTLYPAQPAHLFITMTAKPEVRCLLYGALFARAMILRMRTPMSPARIYTQLRPTDAEMLDFYLKNGFRANDSEDRMTFSAPTVECPLPQGFSLYTIPLTNEDELRALITRANAYRQSPIEFEFIERCMKKEGFLALGVYQGAQLTAEIIAARAAYEASVISLYTHPGFRRMGLATALINACGKQFSAQGARTFVVDTLRRNAAQSALMRHYDARFLYPVNLLPGLDCAPLKEPTER